MVPSAAVKLGTVADGFRDRQHVTLFEDAQTAYVGPPSHCVAGRPGLGRRLRTSVEVTWNIGSFARNRIKVVN
jgi:hypothetical protein